MACFRKGSAVSADGDAADEGEGDGWAKFLGTSDYSLDGGFIADEYVSKHVEFCCKEVSKRM